MATPKRGKTPGWNRFANLGFELAAAIGGFALIGYWIGRHYGNPKAGVAVGAVLGIVGGMYNLVRASLIAFREAGANQEKTED